MVVFPNPFSHKAVLTLFNQHFKNATLRIYNSLEAVVKEMTIVRDAMHGVSTDVTIDRDGLTSGIYFVRVSDGETVYTQKVVIE